MGRPYSMWQVFCGNDRHRLGLLSLQIAIIAKIG